MEEEDKAIVPGPTTAGKAKRNSEKELTLTTPDGTFKYQLVPIPGSSRSGISVEELPAKQKKRNAKES